MQETKNNSIPRVNNSSILPCNLEWCLRIRICWFCLCDLGKFQTSMVAMWCMKHKFQYLLDLYYHTCTVADSVLRKLGVLLYQSLTYRLIVLLHQSLMYRLIVLVQLLCAWCVVCSCMCMPLHFGEMWQWLGVCVYQPLSVQLWSLVNHISSFTCSHINLQRTVW